MTKYNFIDLDEPIEMMGVSVVPGQITNPHLRRVIKERGYDFKFKFAMADRIQSSMDFDCHYYEHYKEHEKYNVKYTEYIESR